MISSVSVRPHGKLIIKPESARLTRDTEIFGTMDPYVIIKSGNTSVQTKTCCGGGKTPHWGDVMKSEF